MVIKNIDLQNFQSHVRTTVPLGPFTALVGKSSSGKTAVMRALQWVFYGDWDETYPFDPEKPTAVSVELTDGTKIVRMRDGDTNRATVIRPGQEPLKYKDFGYIIPNIFDLVNLRPIQSGKQKINLNFSLQDEPLFMLSEAYSKPARAQWLGRLYGAHLLNSMLRLMAKDKKEAEASVRLQETQLAAYQNDMARFADLDRQELLLAEAKEWMAKAGELEDLAHDVASFSVDAAAFRNRRRVLEVDTEALRRQVDALASLRAIKEAITAAARTAATLRDRKPLLEANLGALRTAVEALGGLKEAKAAGQAIASLEANLGSRKWVLEVDLKATREDVSRLQDLKVLRVQVGIWMDSKAYLEARSAALTVDPAGLKADVTNLQKMRVLWDEMQSFITTASVVTDKAKKISKDLEEHQNHLRDRVFSSRKCPLCSSDYHTPPGDIAGRLKALVGG